MRGRLLDLGYAAGWALVRAVPYPLAAALFQLAADVAWLRRGPGVRRLRANLSRVPAATSDDADLDRLTRAALRSYARYWLESFRLPVTSADRIFSGFHVADQEILDTSLAAARAEGRGVILALAHMGNWDHAGAWLVLRGFPFATVAERLEPASLFDRFVAYRRRLGMEVLPLTGGERPAFEVLGERLREGGIVCLLSDRDLSGRGIEVRFLGGSARMPPGPALLALRTGALLLPIELWYAGPDWGARVHPSIPVPAQGSVGAKVAAMTQELADVFAGAVARHPRDWHMLQPFWVGDADNADETVA